MSTIQTMWLPRPPANAITATVAPRQQQQQLPPVHQPPQPQQLLPPPPPPPDLLAHKHKPTSVDTLNCHREQARRLRQWILDFTNAPRNDSRHRNGGGDTSDSDYDDEGAMSDDSDAEGQTARRCLLLTGPPGVGKTSLVYLIANELNMHIVESHSSEKRDFRLFKMLKLANQKGKINPIARLFQMKQQKEQTTSSQPNDHKSSRRKRRRTDETNEVESNAAQTGPKSLSLSGGSSIVLFDDVDVVFEEDGPFLKSLAEFIRESKRPVIVTATRFIEHIKSTLMHFEHIQLNKPHLDDCVNLLRNVCRRERYFKIDKVTNCRIIARKFDCDIRQCLNRVHFYGDAAFKNIDTDTSEIVSIEPDFSRLSGHLNHLAEQLEEEERTDLEEEDDSRTILAKLPSAELDVTPTALTCYDTASLLDLMDNAFDLVDRSTLLARWLGGQPSNRIRVESYEHELGEQIRQSIAELAQSLHKRDLILDDKCKPPTRTLDRAASMSPFDCLPRPSDKHRQSPIPTAARMRLRPRRHVEIFNG